MRSQNTPCQITVPNYREPLYGLVSTAMARYSLVQEKLTGAVGDAKELVAANGGRPAFLENDVLVDAEWQAYCKLHPKWHNEIRKSVPVGTVASARYADEIELEGASYFTGIDGSTAAGTALRTAAGKLAIATVGTHRIIGYLKKKVTPYDAATFRWLIELVP